MKKQKTPSVNVAIAITVISFMLSACVSTVEPWEREHFAKSEMMWQPDSLQASFKQHVYTSKEAASGGNATAGGGCGCN